MTSEQRPVVDDLGNIAVHGRSGLVLVVKIETATAGVYEDISASDLFFEISGKLRLALSAGADIYSRQVILTRAQIATLSINQPYAFAIHDETPSTPSTPWAGTITTFGFKTAPTGVPDVDGEAANWTGATVIIQPGGGSPVVVVSYMGQPGVGIPTGGTTGQYLRKSSSTDYATGWDTLTADDVSGLSSTLSTLTSADVSLTSRVSTEEVARAAGDTSLASRISTEETTRASADTSLATAAAATYLPLAGGTMTGALAVIAGTAALPGLAVAGDLNTGIYGVSADVLGVSAGGLNAASFSNGQLSLATAAGGAGVNLAVDGANALALRNGASAQALRIYNTYTDASNYERAGMYWTGNVLYFGTEATGTGTGQAMRFVTAGSGSIIMRSGGSDKWAFLSDGRLVPSTANTYDIGSSSTSARSIYAGTNVVIGYSTTSAAQLHVGAGNNPSLPDGGGVNRTPQVNNSQTANYAMSSVGVNDGTNNYRAGLFVNHTNALWGISASSSTGGAPFVINNGGTEILRLSNTGVATFYGNVLASADATYDWGASGASRFRDGFLSRNLTVGGTAPAGAAGISSIQAFGQTFSLIGGSVLTDATAKYMRLGMLHYTNAEEPFTLLMGSSISGANTVNIGGGTGSGNAATSIGFYTAANNTTTTGTLRLSIDSSGHLIPGADATYDLGSSSQQIRDAYISRYLKIGGAAPAGVATAGPVIQAFGRTYAVIGAHVLTDAATKGARFGVAHYTNAEKPLIALYGVSTLTTNEVNIAGGSSDGVAGTAVYVWTAANNTTATGTARWQWNSSGHYLAYADNTYDIGAAGANRARNIYAANAFVAGGGIDAGSRVYIYTGTPIPAGGTTGAGYRMSSTANFGVFFGSGAPTLSAAKGSLYLRSDGSGTSDRMYVNTDGGTTWTAVTTAT